MEGRCFGKFGSSALAGAILSVLVPVAVRAETVPASSDVAVPIDQTASDETIVLVLADFARFAPRTALDLVEKIPDFMLSETSDDRGLGQASQNVLINGQRVAGKTNDARTTLARIAASAVERIELTDGARLGIPGLTGRVANVIVRSSDLSVQFSWEGQNRRDIPDQWTTGSISASGRIGSSDITLSLSNSDALRRGGVGPEVELDGAGQLLTTRWQRDVFSVDSPRLSGSLHRETAAGSILNLSLSGELYRFRSDLSAVATPAAGTPVTDEQFRQWEDDWNVEAGADYEFALGSGRLKLIGLQRFEHSPVHTSFRAQSRELGAVARGSTFDRMSDEGESVVRAEYGWGANGSEWQVALEGAYNFVDVSAIVGRLQPDGSITRQPLAGGDALVDEWRGNASVTRSWSLGTGISLQTSIGSEYSRIRQTGAGGLSRSFVRPKGAAALAWSIDRQWTFNSSIERLVGQLSFLDFSAAVDLNNGVANAGNSRLVPSQSWRIEGEFVRSLGPAGSITLGGYGEWISDIVDRVPISATEEGVGNLPRARRWGIIGRGTVLLDSLGWKGGRINASGEFRQSRVRDPLTGDQRRISDDLVRRWSVDLRHDIPNSPLAWGGSLSEDRRAPIFRLDQLLSTHLTQPIATLFVEHKDVMGLTVRLALRNVLDGHDDIRRTYYVNRRDGPIDTTEHQIRYIRPIGVLTISGTF